MFYRYKPSNKIKIPVYLVDEEIYAKCPTIILSTVDKFARLPWDVNTNALFGRVDRICSRDGYVAIGADHARHNRTEELPTSTLRSIKPFLPPELIIQDELHLITGPLGTVYGAYETVIEDLCSYTIGEKKIKPKYVVSTATIKNAAEQTKCLYGRKVTAQFPPNGFEIGDSFYIREVPVEQDPFRRYVGVCAPGQSVKTALLRVYSIILQSAYNLSLDDEYKDVIDPYYTLVGYYNSIRELGGAVRLLQDDIPDRIQRIKKKYGSLKHKLMLQSLSPLAFLTIVRNFKFTPVSELAENQSYWGEFVRLNNVLIVVFLLCATWILAAIISFISFTAFRWTDKKQGYQLSSFVEKEDASLNFFMTMIIPLLIDDVGTIQGAVTFLIIVVMMCALLSKTHLYYANPVLAILGYRVYEITFKSNPDFNNEICLAVVKGRFLKNPSTVEYKVINDTVLYMKEMNK